MITADDLRACRHSADIVDLFRRLGYPTERVEIDPLEWRRAGVELPGNGDHHLSLIARLDHFDLFLASGPDDVEAVTKFMRDYAEYNVITKSAFINHDEIQRTLTIHVLTGKSSRHTNVDCANPTPHSLDRLNLLALGIERDPHRLFCRALDREAVARQFFLRFRAAVRDLAGALTESCGGESRQAVEEEALLILSRLLFLSFVQEKGWLNGERRFLIDRAERACRDDADFFATVLSPLFFGCLNTPLEARDDIARALGTIPYLNGGLFEPASFERRNPAMRAPSELMRRILDDVFEKFDFTVDENDAAGTRVDPEMLGKVFESLMAEDERAATGSFYTPREIVDVLTSRAIAEWVSAGNLDLRDDLLEIIRGEAPSLKVQEVADDIIGRLKNVTVLDPACGSGAFLLSALHVIEKLLVALAPTECPTALRQSIVERSLYGVDLKPEAVRLCELRLWLAIVAGADVSLEEVRPLPNLDRNILQGNSLLGPLDFLGNARAEIYREWAWGLRAQQDLIERYRHARREERPALYRLVRANDRRLATDLLSRAIEADERELHALMAPCRDLFGNEVEEDLAAIRVLQQRLTDTRRMLERVETAEVDFFAFDVHFAHVLGRGGFDVVVGNPPWVRSARIEPSARRMYRERYRLFARTAGATPFHQPDLSVAFVERSIGVAAADGVVSMLVPAKIANAAYAEPLREFLLGEGSLAGIIDWSEERKQHFNADTFPLGLIIRRAAVRAPIDIHDGTEWFRVAARELSVDGRGSEWSLVPPAVAQILRRVRRRFGPLEEVLSRRPVMGVKTGDNRTFFFNATRVDRQSVETAEGIAIPPEFVCRAVRGRDVRRWSTRESQWMIWPPAGGWKQFPTWLQQLAISRGVEPDVFKLAYVRAEHVGIKVVWKDVSRGMAATVLPESVDVSGHPFALVPNQTLYCVDAVSLDEAYAVAGLLNSVVVDALLLATAERAKDDHYRYFARTVARVPFPLPGNGSAMWQRLVRSSRIAHRDGGGEEHERLVAELYELTREELEVLRAHVTRRLASR